MNINSKIKDISNELDKYIIEYKSLSKDISKYNDIDISNKLDNVNLDTIDIDTFSKYLEMFDMEQSENIKNFKSLSMTNFKKYFPKSYDEVVDMLTHVIDDINNKIDIYNKDIEMLVSKRERLEILNRSIGECRDKIDFYKNISLFSKIELLDNSKALEIKKYISNIDFLSEEELLWVIDFITSNILSNIDKGIIKKEDSIKKLNEEFEKEVVLYEEEDNTIYEEEKIESNSLVIEECINDIRELLSNYQDIYVSDVDFITLEDISNITSQPDNSDIESVIFAISYVIDYIRSNNNSVEDREKYVLLYKSLKDIYINKYKIIEENRRILIEKRNRYIDLENAYNELEGITMSIYGSKTYLLFDENDREYFESFNNDVKIFIERLKEYLTGNDDDITTDIYNDLMNEYKKYIVSFNMINDYYNNSSNSNIRSNEIKSFIINEIDSNTNLSTVLCDFTARQLVDEAALSSGRNWKEEYSAFINELISYGFPLMLANSNSSVSNFAEKIDDFVYFDKNRTDKSGLHRYRATRNSNVRFVEKRIELNHNTLIFKQVRDMILSYLPNVSIDPDKDFIIYLNFANMVKKDDKDGYNVAIRRLSNSNLMKLFYQNGKYKSRKGESDGDIKNALEDKDLILLEEYISKSINAYKTLNEEYGFNIDFVNFNNVIRRKEA